MLVEELHSLTLQAPEFEAVEIRLLEIRDVNVVLETPQILLDLHDSGFT